MDTTIRRRQREAAAGDPAAEAAWLAERLRAAPGCERCDASTYGAGTLRVATTTAALVMCPSCAGTGSPFRARLELAAYCGSEAARAALGDPPRGFPIPFTIKDPPTGMDRLAYRWHVLDVRWGLGRWVAGLSRWSDVGPVPGWVLVRAAVAAARLALPKYMADAHGLGISAHGRLYEIDPGEWTSRAALNEAIDDAAHLAGDAPVRAAICASLIEWALA